MNLTARNPTKRGNFIFVHLCCGLNAVCFHEKESAHALSFKHLNNIVEESWWIWICIITLQTSIHSNLIILSHVQKLFISWQQAYIVLDRISFGMFEFILE